jgi:hypothetical protein
MPGNAMRCIIYKIYLFFEVFSYVLQFDMHLYAHLCGQNFILVKSGCYNQGVAQLDCLHPLNLRPPCQRPD